MRARAVSAPAGRGDPLVKRKPHPRVAYHGDSPEPPTIIHLGQRDYLSIGARTLDRNQRD
ncbi:MAG: hypothetical protein GF353_01610 [Candidatus Lokiarchaeota archaeon]|nr:hypothetical protein [Candidatus Lokiarchaeota archaeon]